MKNLKSYVLVGLFCSGITLGTYKLAGLDKREIVFTETSNPGINQLTSDRLNPTPPSPSAAPRPVGPGALPVDFTFAAQKTTPAVVHIQSTMVSSRSASESQQLPEFFRDFFGEDFRGQSPGGSQEQKASGSGVIFTTDGYIITNNHVVEDASEVEVILYDKRTFKARVVGTDPTTDLAVLQIKANNLPFLVLGNSDDVKVGQWVLAVGNPFNLESTVTAGIVSAKGRNIGILGQRERQRAYNEDPSKSQVSTSIESFIQTDAAVNPGNSGGALVNLEGELIGINTAIATPTGTFAGYSFAVPAGLVRKVSEDLVKYGAVQRGYLGVNIENMNGKLANKLNLDVYEGVYVSDLVENGSAKAAGIRKGDVIVKIDGAPVRSSAELQESIGRHKPGETVTATVYREGKEQNIRVELKNRAGNNDLVRRVEAKEAKAEVTSALGANFQELTDKEKKELGLTSGVKVSKLTPGKLKSQTDMREGFIITKADGKPVRSVKELNQILEGKRGDEDGVTVQGVYPNYPGKYYYAFGM